MVYCGKPSKGCQMCRTRRIKCDETKPTCNQCAKARRQCPGYKDEFDLVLRNENLAAKRRALKISTPRRSSSISKNMSKPSPGSTLSSPSSSSSTSSTSPTTTPSPDIAATNTTRASSLFSPGPGARPRLDHHRQQQQQQQQEQQQQEHSLSLTPSPIHIPPEDLAPCYFISNFVLVPREDGTGGYLDYLIPLLTQGRARDEQTHLQHAFNACALASLGNRVFSSSSASSSSEIGVVGLPGWGWDWGGEGAESCLGKAFAEYSRALRATQAALVDSEQWRSDEVLAAVLLLGLFENITAKKMGSLAWGSHVEGAIQLVKARGRSLLKTKLGMQLFLAVRTQLIIHALTSGTAPAMGAEWWMQDALGEPITAECQRFSLLTGELRAEATRVMAAAARTPESIQLVQGLMRRAHDLDEQVTAWMDSVPEAWQYRTLCWQPHNLAVPGGGSDYSKAEVFPGRVDVYSDFWVSALWNRARTARLILMSIAVRCAAWVCSPVDYRTTPEYATATKVCVDTISDILASVPYHLGWHTKRRDLFSDKGTFGFACGEEFGIKGLAGYFLTWPLACVVSQDYTTDAQRAYVKGRLNYIGDELGIKYSYILSQLPIRVPSMLIRSDGLMAKPYPMAHDFEKLLSSARRAYPLPGGYSLNQLPQQQATVQEQPQQSQAGGQHVMQTWISV